MDADQRPPMMAHQCNAERNKVDRGTHERVRADEMCTPRAGGREVAQTRQQLRARARFIRLRCQIATHTITTKNGTRNALVISRKASMTSRVPDASCRGTARIITSGDFATTKRAMPAPHQPSVRCHAWRRETMRPDCTGSSRNHAVWVMPCSVKHHGNGVSVNSGLYAARHTRPWQQRNPDDHSAVVEWTAALSDRQVRATVRTLDALHAALRQAP